MSPATRTRQSVERRRAPTSVWTLIRAAASALVFAQIVLTVASLSAQSIPAAAATTCREWHECQQLAVDAYTRREYERFHDLAWRTVQTGPARDPDLMYLLARAQSLSGRPHDALVILGRLSKMGFIRDIAADNDFRAVRELRQWPELEAAMTTPSARPASVSPPVLAVTPRAEEAMRLSGNTLRSSGLAYDRVSSRFVMADAGQRKLVIVDERSRRLVDLVTSASAGFYDITALEIDPARGDLWVVSAESPTASDRSPASALHKLQLVSGRPLERIPIPADLQPCRLADVAVMPNGVVLVLDTVGKRLLRFQSGMFKSVAALSLESPTSMAAASNRIVYVTHGSGIARVDIVTGAVEALASSRDVQLAGFERIRWALNSLVGIQRLADGTQRAVRIKIVGSRAAAIELLDSGLSSTDLPVATVSGDEFYFLVQQSEGDASILSIRRSRLR